MQTNGPTISAAVLAGLRSALAKRPGLVDELFGEAGIDGAEIDLMQPLSFEKVAQLFQNAANRIPDANFGLHYALAYPPGASGLLGQLVLSAPSIRHALEAAATFSGLYMTGFTTQFHEENGVGRFALCYPVSISASRCHFTMFVLAIIASRIRIGAGPDWMPLSAEFEHRQPADLEVYKRMFGPRLTFNAASNSFTVDGPTLGKPMPKTIDGIFDSVKELSTRLMAEQRERTELVAQVRDVIAQRMGSEPFDLEAIATTLGMAARTLQWRLEQESTGYEKVLTSTRSQLSEQLLRDTDLPIGEIANRLGFSELSAFTRWMRQNTGRPPTAQRAFLRDGTDVADTGK